jgi:hypothetical protein
MYSAHETVAPGGPPSAVWDRVETAYNFVRDLDSASDGTMAVSLHQILSPGQGALRHTRLRKFSTVSGELLWDYESPVQIPGHSFSGVGISADGEIVVQLVYDSFIGRTRVTAFDATYDSTSPAPTLDLELHTYGHFRGFELSGDGSTLLIGSDMALTFFDVGSGQVLEQKFLIGTPQYGALSVSGDGSVACFGTYGRVIAYARGEGGGFTSTFEVPLGPGQYAASVAVSENGSTLAVGAQNFGQQEDARIVSVDAMTGEVLWDRTFAGLGTHQNIVAELSITPDGKRFAAGLWGDEGDLVPEVMVFKRGSPEPILSYHLPGSVLALDLAPGGHDLAVGSKGTHANVLGGGGSLSYFKVGPVDLGVTGIPRLGQEVTIEVAVRSGGTGRVLVSKGLAPQPVEAPQFGTGLMYLDLDQLVVDLGSVPADEDHIARSTYSVVLDQTVYVQAVNEHLGRLSSAWVPITPVP